MAMREQLKKKLFEYIAGYNPELLLKFEGQLTVTTYVDYKVTSVMDQVKQWLSVGVPGYEAEEMALAAMIAELRPSKFIYLKNVLEEDFSREAEAYLEAGVLTSELVNLIEHCQETFTTFGFSEENQNDRKLRYAIIADIADYIN